MASVDTSKVTRRAASFHKGNLKVQTVCMHCGRKQTRDYAKSKKPEDRGLGEEMLKKLIKYWNGNGGTIIHCTCKGTPHTVTDIPGFGLVHDCYCGWKRSRETKKGERT